MSLSGEPAYPVQAYYRDNGALLDGPQPGLTKRELFAAMAMQGFCAIPKINCTISPEIVARDAARLADALLAELVKEPT